MDTYGRDAHRVRLCGGTLWLVPARTWITWKFSRAGDHWGILVNHSWDADHLAGGAAPGPELSPLSWHCTGVGPGHLFSPSGSVPRNGLHCAAHSPGSGSLFAAHFLIAHIPSIKAAFLNVVTR